MWLLAACVSDPGPRRSRPPVVVPAPAPAPPPNPPNVLLVVLDDFGGDRPGYAGNPFAFTPTLDALAAEGRWFRNAWGYPVCGPARAALFTGRHAPRTGFVDNVGGTRPYHLDPAQTTIAELVGDADPPWDSAFVGKWHLEHRTVPFEGPTAHGWRWFSGTPQNIDDYRDWFEVGPDGRLSRSHRYATTRTTDVAIGRLAALREPWLLTVAYHAVHEPNHAPPEELLHRPIREEAPEALLRLAMEESVDTELGRLLDALAPVRDHTLVVVIGDNGDTWEGLVEHPERGKVTITEGGVGVPFVVTGPGVGEPGPSDALVSVVDVFPTVAELAGVDLDTLRGVLDPSRPLALDGISLVGVLADAATEVHAELFSGRAKPDGAPPWDTQGYIVRDHTHALRVQESGEWLYRYGAEIVPDELPVEGRAPDDVAAADALRERLIALRAAMTYDAAR